MLDDSGEVRQAKYMSCNGIYLSEHPVSLRGQVSAKHEQVNIRAQPIINPIQNELFSE